MPDYQKSKLYIIRVVGSDNLYIGSTVNSLCKRMTGHRDTYKKWKGGNGTFCSSYYLFEIGTPYIELLEEYPCDNKEQLLKKEGGLIRTTENCINKCIAGRTYKEWYDDNKDKLKESNKQYRQANKDKIKEIHKQYRQANKDKIKEHQTLYAESHREAKRAYDLKRRTEKREYVNNKQTENRAKRKLAIAKSEDKQLSP